MKNLLLLTALLIANIANAQAIKGIVLTDQKPLNIASSTLHSTSDSTLVMAVLSNKNGEYVFEKIKAGNYFIQVSAVGFATANSNAFQYDGVSNINVETINLIKASKKLGDVKLVSKKPYIEVKADKTVVNVEQNLSNTGNSILEVLRKSPGVVVDKDDNLSLKGKNGVLVYIDGRQTYLDPTSLAAMLKNMQSNTVESIELISNPSSKYDAAGNAGIINIKLKKDKRKGMFGNASIGLNYGFTPKVNGSISLTKNTKKASLFALYSVDAGNYENRMNFERIQNGFEFNQLAINSKNEKSHTYKLAADYNLNSKNVIGAMLSGNYTDGIWSGNSKTFISPQDSLANQILYGYNTIPGNSNNLNGNINYKFSDTNGTSLNIDLDKGFFKKRANSLQPNTYTDINNIVQSRRDFRSVMPTNIDINTAKFDYERKALKGKVGLGAKVSYVVTDNDFKFFDVINNLEIEDANRSNHFKYTENVNAAYANYNRSWLNDKWTAQMGLRLEQTNSKAMLKSAVPTPEDTVSRSYTNLFPSAGISYNRNSKHSFNLAYSRRIERPTYENLNPFEFKLDELSYQKGNPFLRPQYAHSFDFTHTYRQSLNTTLNFSRITDVYSEIVEVKGNAGFVTNRNLASQNVWSINTGSPLPIKKWWFGYVNLGLAYNDVSAKLYSGDVRVKYASFNGYMEHNITLKKNWGVSASGWYAGPGYWGAIFKSKGLGALDIGASKALLNKKLNCKLSITDLFWSSQWKGSTNYGPLNMVASGRNESRMVRLNISYRFGGQGTSVRDRQTGLDSEKNRVKSGR